MNLLGIDFEEWFHPELIQQKLTNEKKSFKIIKGLDKILDLFHKHETYATFFVVGEILKESPEIFDKIINCGHEIAFHTMYHSRLDSEGFEDKFPNELEEFGLLTNKKSKGFRAPTFSLNRKSNWAIDVLEKYDYKYDSSIMPAKSTLYGNPNAPKIPYRISGKNLDIEDASSNIIEFPLMVTKILGKTVPASGGFYLRTLPMSIIKKAFREYEKNNIPVTFYIHSWELTPEYMPRIELGKKSNFITYHNLEKAFPKIEELLNNFKFTTFEHYLKTNTF